MKRKLVSVLLAALALAALPLAAPHSANATGASPEAGRPPAVVKVSDLSQDATALAYWTPARMRAAAAADEAAAPGTAGSGPNSPGSGSSGSGGVAPGQGPPLFDVYSIGKLFIHRSHHGDFSCTAVTVSGGRRNNLAATAAHCLKDHNGPLARATYVPGYFNGTEPVGQFPLRGYALPNQYDPYNPGKHDAGFMYFGQNCCGKNLGDVSNQNGIRFHDNPNQTVALAGYGNAQGNSQRLSDCTGIQAYSDPDDRTRIATNCLLGPGASGGPLLIPSSGNHRYDILISVNHGTTHSGNRQVGPLFGTQEKAAFDQAVADSANF
ncbi:hypothetical protein ABZ769_32240 [Streptomyces olivoreticuli]